MVDEAKVLIPPSDVENQVAFSGAAPGVNRFVASLGDTGLRVAFIEIGLDGSPHFRGAVTMHPQDGISLYKLLQEMLAPLEAVFAKMAADNNG